MKNLSFAFAAAITMFIGGSASCAEIKAGTLTIDTPWSRATPGGAAVAAGYLIIKNTGATADRLIGGTSDIAGRVEIHEMSMTNNIMRMRPLEKGLEIAPGGKVELKPGGYHIMFTDMKRQLKQGETFKTKLNFEKAGAVELEFKVEGVGAQTPAASMQMPMQNMH